MRNIAGKHTVNANQHAGVEFAELSKGREQGVDGAFVDAEGKFAAIEAGELGEAFFYFVAKVDEALGVVAQERAGVGEADRARAADKERLAEAVFELANCQADGGLGAVEAFGGAGEAAFARYGEKDLQFA